MRAGIRSQGDIEQAERLAKVPTVEEYARRGSRDKLDDTRRHLLGSAVRLTRTLAPEVHEIVDHCAKRLEIDKECEVYVSPSPHFNAFSYRSGNGRVYVGVTSSLFEAFDREELTFVIGHELGHYLCSHLDLPSGDQVRGSDHALALSLSAWHRHAEISADRAGLECVRDVGVVARTFLKLSSGLTRASARYDVNEYLGQLADLRAEAATAGDEMREEWMSSHPFSPLRIRAAQLCWDSSLFTSGGTSLELLEVAVHRLLSIMEPNYAADRTTAGEAMRRVLLAAGMSIAASDGTIDDQEVAALAQFLGEPPGSANAKALRADLPRRLAFAIEQVSANKRYQLVRDLCVIAHADRRVTPEECALLREVAEGLRVDPMFIDMSLKDIARGLD